MTALDLAARALRGELSPGFHTPARACGPDYVLGSRASRARTSPGEHAADEPPSEASALHRRAV